MIVENRELTENPIGLFDSGVGGLTVMQSIKSKLPKENLIYFGDTARVPYGGKSRDTILRYSLENAAFLIKKKIKFLVVACNTVSAYALPYLEEAFSIPVVGVIEAGVDAAIRISKGKRIAVLGTRGTIASGAYQELFKQKDPCVELFTVSCPLLVPLVEENFITHPAARLIVQEYLRPLCQSGIDTLLLGCTHYPFLKQIIQDEIGRHVQIVDSASTCADMVFEKLFALNALRRMNTSPAHQYYVSDDPDKFGLHAETLLGECVSVSLENIKVSFADTF